MWFTKEERIGLLLIGVSMLVGGIILNKKEEAGLRNLKDSAIEVFEEAPAVKVENDKILKGKLNINSASFEELVKVPGIGPKTASLILERRQREKFRSIEELKEIKGIGDKKLQKLKEYVEVK
jgi:competence protein ComEA